ncbi:unnamed protein product [Prorocentrum cordatum]|uniref:Uncharacterized protein n=1 Tax=Prorocentrum cordatum TaxID=2364126 RepID=A0ABN9V2L3_9DINO|nr:unnamed protein product [Polarella glacialis]
MNAVRADSTSLTAFNPFSLTDARGEEVSSQLRQIQIAGCPGAKIPKHPRSPRRAQRHECRAAQGVAKLKIITANSPPAPRGRETPPQRRATMTKVSQWVKQEILDAPPRFTPIVMMDLNDRFAAGPDGDETVGQPPTGKQGEAGKLYHHTLANACMAVANTYYDTGPTCDGRHPSVTDCIYFPTGLVSRIMQCRVWSHAARALQISRKFKDQKPLITMLEAPPACRTTSRAFQTIGRDAIALGLKGGHKRIESPESLECNPSARADLLGEYLTHEGGTYHSGLAMQCFRDAALGHCAIAHGRPDWCREAREHKLPFLKERAQLRQRRRAHDDHPDANEDHLRQLDETIHDLSKKLRRHLKDTYHKYQEMQRDDLWRAWRARPWTNDNNFYNGQAPNEVYSQFLPPSLSRRNYAELDFDTMLEQEHEHENYADDDAPPTAHLPAAPTTTTPATNPSTPTPPRTSPLQLNYVTEIVGELAAVAKLLGKANRRKCVSACSAPAEILLMALRPELLRRLGRPQGCLGALNAPDGSEDPFKRKVQLDKGKVIPGPAGLRLIHCFDVFWRCFYRHLRERGFPTRPPDYAYGGIPQRRREFGMIATRAVAGKLRRAKIAFAVRSHDGRNAFGCTHHDAINGHVIPTFRDGDRQLALQRRTESQTVVEASDGTLTMRNREGGSMGCSNEPDAVMKDLSRQVFVDDILKFHIAPRVGPRKPAIDSSGQLRDASIDEIHALTAIIERDLERLVFQAVVYEAAISAAETYFLYATDYKKIDICLGKRLRAMLQGKGCQHSRDTHYKAMSAAEAWRRWDIVPGSIELRICSDLPAMPLTLTDDGYISPDAHPIARQMATDIQDLLTYDTAEPSDLLDWKGNIITLFTGPEIAEAFCRTDVSIMRESDAEYIELRGHLHSDLPQAQLACPAGSPLTSGGGASSGARSKPGDRSRSQRRGLDPRKKAEDQGAELDDQKVDPGKGAKKTREHKVCITKTAKVIVQEKRNYAQDGDSNTTIERASATDQYQAQDAPICKLEKAYKSGQAKIHCRDYESRQHIMTALHNADKATCAGPAPAGSVEGELAFWVEALRGETYPGGRPCTCGQRGCVCDLSTVDDLGPLMASLGYDQCVEDGGCEACDERDAHAVYCNPTGRRQRVACAHCGVPGAPAIFCIRGVKPLWAASAATAAHVRNASGVPALFFRSCSGRETPPLQPRPPRTSGAQVLMFLAFNALVFSLSFRSLRRQQRALWQETHAALYGDGGGAGPPEGDARPLEEDRRGEVSKAQDAGGVVAEQVGRPAFAAGSLASSASRAREAVELAVFGDGPNKTK